MNQALEGDLVETNGDNGVVAHTLASGRALQQVRTSYVTAVAVQKPRELIRVEKKLLEEARLAGESFYYGWGVGKNRIEGPSIELATAAARCWGNCATEMAPVQDMPTAWIFTASFIDLETGYTRTRQFRQSKNWTVHGQMDDERKTDIRFNIGQSKAERNVILKALPGWLIDKAMAAAKSGVREMIEGYIKKNGLPAAIDIAMRALEKHGIKEDRVCAKFGLAAATALDLDALVVIKGDLHAIESGQERAEALFPSVEELAGKSKTEQLKDKLKAGQQPEKPKAEATTAPPSAPAEKAEPNAKTSSATDNGGPVNAEGSAPSPEREPGDDGDEPPVEEEMAKKDYLDALRDRLLAVETAKEVTAIREEVARDEGLHPMTRQAAIDRCDERLKKLTTPSQARRGK